MSIQFLMKDMHRDTTTRVLVVLFLRAMIRHVLSNSFEYWALQHLRLVVGRKARGGRWYNWKLLTTIIPAEHTLKLELRPTPCLRMAVTKTKSHESTKMANTSHTTRGSLFHSLMAETLRAEWGVSCLEKLYARRIPTEKSSEHCY